MKAMRARSQVCPNCGAPLDGIYNSVPRNKLRWYKGSTARGCARCGIDLSYDRQSMRWLLLNLILVVPAFWPGPPPAAILYGCVALAVFGDVMFVLKRKIVAKGS